jgi:hypothetical protein
MSDDSLEARLQWPHDPLDARAPEAAEVPPLEPDGQDDDGEVSTDSGVTTTDPTGSALARTEPEGSVLAAPVSLSGRLDSLASSADATRRLLSDRLGEYSENVNRFARTQSADLNDYRHTTERVIAELRRASLDAEESLHRMSGRLDEVAADVAEAADLARVSITEGRDFSSTTQRMSHSIRDGLEGFTTSVLERLDQMRRSLETELATVRADAARLRQAVTDAASAWNAERAELSSDRMLEEIRNVARDLAALRAEMAHGAGDARVVDDGEGVEVGELFGELHAVRTEVAALRRRMAIRAGGSGLSADDISAVADALGDRLLGSIEFADEGS